MLGAGRSASSEHRPLTSVLGNGFGDAACAALPHLLPARFAQVDDLEAVDMVVRACVLCSRLGGGLEQGLCFVPRHCRVILGVDEHQLEPRASSWRHGQTADSYNPVVRGMWGTGIGTQWQPSGTLTCHLGEAIVAAPSVSHSTAEPGLQRWHGSDRCEDRYNPAD